jgi:hypothetical protein
MQSNDKEALARLELERDRRILEKVARGEAVLLPPIPIVVGHAKPVAAVAKIERDAQGREIYHGTLRDDGTIDPGISMIVTGVPRPGRDDDGEPPAPQAKSSTWKCSICGRTFPNEVTIHRCEPIAHGPKPPPPRPVPPPPSLEEAPPRRHIWTQTRPATEAEPAGAIAEGSYSVDNDNWIYVWDGAGNHIGRLKLAPGEDAAVVARRLLRDKTGSNAFYAPLRYPTKTFH